jgi:hypothetical protein
LANARLGRDRIRIDRRLGLLVFAAALAVYITTAGGSMATTDAVVAYDLTRQMVDHGTIALSGNLIGNIAYQGLDGRFYSPFGLAQSVWNVPFFLGGRLVSQALGWAQDRADMATKAAVVLGSGVAAAACVLVVWLFAISLGAGRRVAVAAAAVVGFATSLWPYSKFGFNVPLSALLLVAAHYAAWRAVDTPSRTPAWLSGFWAGWAFLTRHEFAIAAGMLACWLAGGVRRDRTRIVAWWVIGLLPEAVVWGMYNHVRYGSPFDAGYLRDQVPAWGSSVLAGIAGLLFSPGASIFIYCPIAVLGVWTLIRSGRTHARLGMLVLAEVAVFTLFYAQLGNWVGGRSYGPRYLVPFLPLICLPLAVWLQNSGGVRKRVAVGLAALSLFVQVPGVLVDFATVRVAHAQLSNVPGRPGDAWSWSSAPLVLNTKAAMVAVPTVVRHLAGVEPRPSISERREPGDRTFSQQFAFSLDFWWIYLFYLGVWSGPCAIAAGALLLLSILLLARAVWALASRAGTA